MAATGETAVPSSVASVATSVSAVAAGALMQIPAVSAAKNTRGGGEVLLDNVDLMEVNHFYDEQGRLVLDQIIFYDWSDSAARFQVRAWRLKKTDNQIPQMNPQRTHYEALWHDGNTLRKVRAKYMRESWTQYDPELTEQQNLAKEKRTELQRIPPN